MTDFDKVRQEGRLLYETVRGSTLFGLSIEGSDVDTFGLFIAPENEMYGSGLNYRGMIKSEKNDDSWDELQKYIIELGKSNPNALESLFTPEKFVLYKNPIIQPLIDIRETLLTKQCMKSFRGYAKSQINKMYSLTKSMNIDPDEVKERKTPLHFCWVPRPGNDGVWSLDKYLRENGLKQEHCGITRLPNGIEFYTLYYDWFADKTLNSENYARLRYGISSEDPRFKDVEQELWDGQNTEMIKYRGILDPNAPDSTQLRLSSITKEDSRESLISFQFNANAFSSHCRQYKDYWNWVKNRNPKRYEENKGHSYDAKNSCHCVRLLRMGREIAEGQGMILDRTNIDRQELLDIKLHHFSYEEVKEIILREEQRMLSAFEQSNLPEEPDVELLENILIDIRRKHYKRDI